MTHGRIRGGVVTTPDLDLALRDYRDTLGLLQADSGPLGDVAAAWGVPGLAAARTATLQPASGAPCFVRLVEQPLPPGYRATTTYGWNAYELTVRNVFGWPDRLVGSGFTIVGPPKHVPSFDSFVAMQATGRGEEMIYLNEVHHNTDASDLPRARSPIDYIFIVILGAADRAAAVEWYAQTLHLDTGATYTLPYSMINQAFGFPPAMLTTITMVQRGRMPIVEIDGYPGEATVRAVAAGHLPAGNALVSLEVDDLAALDLVGFGPVMRHPGPVYAGRASTTLCGPAGELIELIETPNCL